MAVLGLHSVWVEVPDLEEGIKFYTDAGLEMVRDGQWARFTCAGQRRDSLILIGGASRKRLHHVCLCADSLADVQRRVMAEGGAVIQSPTEFPSGGLWVQDPHGTLFHIIEDVPESGVVPVSPYEINQPGRIVRIARAGAQRKSQRGPVKPVRLGHVVLFSPDVDRSVDFVTKAFGLCLSDRVDDVIGFCSASKNSDHHILAFGQSSGIGIHHISFQVADPDDVGRGGRALADKAKRSSWGLGRHLVGSNFFYYVRDPWGSWFEYYADMDFIDDYKNWSPTNYEAEEAFDYWGPIVPEEFSENTESL